MESALNTSQDPPKSSSPYFKSLWPLPPSDPNPQNGDPSIPTDITFYKSALLDNKVILFGKASRFMRGSQSLWTFDLETLKWGMMDVAGSSFLADNKEDYSLCITQDQQIVLFGYLGQLSLFARNTGGGIFVNGDIQSSGRRNTKGASVERLVRTESEGMKWVQDQNQTLAPSCIYHSANALGDKMYVFGGFDQNGHPTNDLYEYSLGSSYWKQIQIGKEKPEPRYSHSTVIHQRSLYVFGGSGMGAGHHFNDIWTLDLERLTWNQIIPITKLYPLARSHATMYAFGQTLLIFGGQQSLSNHHHNQKAALESQQLSNFHYHNDILAFDTDTRAWNHIQIEDLPLTSSSCSVLFHNDEFILQDTSDFFILNLNLNKLGEKAQGGTKLAEQMKNLFTEKTYHDIKFKVEDKEIPAYKGILITRCPYFAKMFASGMKESQEQVIEVPDVKYEVYYKLIEYLYCDEIELTKDIAVGLLKLSDEYCLPILKTICAKYLVRILDYDNYMELANLASHYQVNELRKPLLNYLISFKTSLLQNINIKDLPRDLLEDYLINT